MADEDVRSQKMSADEIQLRKDELKWQQRKFVITIGLMAFIVLIFAVLWIIQLEDTFYLNNRDFVYLAERLNLELRDQRERQEMFADRLEELEKSQITLHRLTDASKGTIQELRRLLNELLDQPLSEP